MKLPRSDRESLAICAAARQIWSAIRNREHGSELNSAAYESAIIAEITAVVEPYRERIEKLDAERHEFSERANEAYRAICKLKSAIREALACNGKLHDKLVEKLKTLEKTGYQHLRCKLVDEVETETEPIAAEDDDDADCEIG
jgi:hypothetical protein